MKYRAIIEVDKEQLIKYAKDFHGEQTIQSIEDAIIEEFGCLEDAGITLDSVEEIK